MSIQFRAATTLAIIAVLEINAIVGKPGPMASVRGVITGGFALTAVSYLVLNLFYSLAGKRMVLLDVIIIAIGFVLRALAGAQAIEVALWN